MALNNQYENPLISRYASAEMSEIFSPQYKFSTWRKLWLYLAEGQKKAGLKITDKQLKSMRANLDNIDFSYAAKLEKKLRHDVMAHVHTFAKVCPEAEKIIHLGVTSAYVGDNTDLIQIKEGLVLVRNKLLEVIYHLKQFSLKHKALPCLAYTHFQPAQPTTVGKRGCLWLQDFLLDLSQLNYLIEELPFRGIKGTTGTQASFVHLFQNAKNSKDKIDAIEKYVSKMFGFKKVLMITGQIYTRKLDYQVTSLLSGIAQSASKIAGDIRLLSHKKELEEPFEKNQIGSSAMAYKKNPMRSERIHSLARFTMSQTFNTAYTASTQWFERTLDDSANKRLAIPQAFLAVDAILELLANVMSGVVVYPKVVAKNLNEELPFMLTENIMMECVTKKKANRQAIHELIRTESFVVAKQIKEGGTNDLLERLANHPSIPLSLSEIEEVIKQSKITGRSQEMVERFIQKEVTPQLRKRKAVTRPEIRV